MDQLCSLGESGSKVELRKEWTTNGTGRRMDQTEEKKIDYAGVQG